MTCEGSMSGRCAPRQVHLLAGLGLPTTKGRRAFCSCGWSTTPRASADRAIAALETEHGYQDPVCDLCGRDRSDTSLPHSRRNEHVHVLLDDATGHQFIACRDDERTCLDLARRQQVHLDRSALEAFGVEPPSVSAPMSGRATPHCAHGAGLRSVSPSSSRLRARRPARPGRVAMCGGCAARRVLDAIGSGPAR